MPEIDWPARARELAADFATRAREHDREASFPHENFAALHEAGFLKLVVPGRYGGYEVPLTTFLRTQEEFGAGDSATALGLNMHQVRFGSEREAGSYPEHWFAEMCRGAVEHGWLSNTAATEEGLGSPAGGGLPETTAVESEGGWLINGRKTFTTMAPALEFLILLARVGTDDDNPEIGTFMLRRGDPGLRVEETWDSLGMRASGSHDLVLEDVHLPADRLMGRRVPGQPDPRGASGQTWFALGVAATTIGIALGARDYAVNFARDTCPRRQDSHPRVFWRPLPGGAHRCAYPARSGTRLRRRGSLGNAAPGRHAPRRPRRRCQDRDHERLHRGRRPGHAHRRRGQPAEVAAHRALLPRCSRRPAQSAP
ncbi:MAG: acyl-CoA dehydrogenase family protein [Dehalococcoidia bacterium]|nr:acyl-CoA dehydrogenase family protein [Dehalococcoidia bacterium]